MKLPRPADREVMRRKMRRRLRATSRELSLLRRSPIDHWDLNSCWTAHDVESRAELGCHRGMSIDYPTSLKPLGRTESRMRMRSMANFRPDAKEHKDEADDEDNHDDKEHFEIAIRSSAFEHGIPLNQPECKAVLIHHEHRTLRTKKFRAVSEG